RYLLMAIAALSLTVIAACSFPTDEPIGEAPPLITTTSGEAEIALAEHLASLGAIKYGAYWCPHCHAQQALFGKEAFEKITYVECDPSGQNPQTATCQAVGVESYPTWEIDGELYRGVQPLETLATISQYSGPTAFQNTGE
ncbi:MAG: hypothetical protein AAFW75_31160, partial [Cyanobacteria bacterium J06636_16]